MLGTPPVAAIERAACRPLGIATTAVHLNAYADADTLLVAHRAAHKQIDPGLWDNLVGGMVPAGESLHHALAREALEEAGLHLDHVELQRGRWFQMRRPVPEGLQSEIIYVYDALLPDGVSLQNQDGEVDAIERRTLNEVINAIENDKFTLESALVTLESVSRRAQIDTPRISFTPPTRLRRSKPSESLPEFFLPPDSDRQKNSPARTPTRRSVKRTVRDRRPDIFRQAYRDVFAVDPFMTILSVRLLWRD